MRRTYGEECNQTSKQANAGELNQTPLHLNLHLKAYMLMQDEKGLDEKVLAVPVNDPRFSEVCLRVDLFSFYPFYPTV